MKWVRDNGLTLALMALFIVSVVGQGWAGWLAESEEQARHGEAAAQLFEYLGGGAFLSALFENWGSGRHFGEFHLRYEFGRDPVRAPITPAA